MAPHKWDPVCAPPTGLVRPVRIDPTGQHGPTRGQAAGPGWRRTSHGFHVPASTPTGLPEQRILEQSMRLPAGGAVSGWAACRLHRAAFLDGLAPDGMTELPVPLAIGPATRVRADPRIALLREPLAEEDVTTRYGIPCTIIERAAFDAMRLAPDVREAVVVADMVAAAALSSLERMRRYVDAHPRYRHVDQARRALALASERSRSPREVHLRLVWKLDAGLPPVWPNAEVRDRTGRLLGVADLLDDEAGLAVEFDGAEHRGLRRHTRDVAKEDAFRRHHIEVVRVTGTDLRDTALVVDRLRAGRRRARFEPRAQRSWVATEPRDWVEQHLLEQEVRRALNTLVESRPLPDIDELRRL